MDSATLGLTRVVVILAMALALAVVVAVRHWQLYPSWLTQVRRRALLHGALVAGWIWATWVVAYRLLAGDIGGDAYAYWAVDLSDVYHGVYGTAGYFPYSPAAALAVAPLGLMPWTYFLVLWIALNVSVVAWLGRRRFLLLLAFPPLMPLLVAGNIEVLLGAAIVLGFRWPAVWAFVLLTKVTPGVGLLWFAVRGEWGALVRALVATLSIVGFTWLLLPAQWTAWVALLLQNDGGDIGWLPLMLRLPIAALLVVWGALTDRRWTVVAGAMIAVPHFWLGSLGGLVALAALDGRPAESDLGAVRPSHRSVASVGA